MPEIVVSQPGTIAAAASGQDQTYTDMIMRELAALQTCLRSVGEQVAEIDKIAGELDGQVTFVDEEATRVEAPTDTRAAMDACVSVANVIAEYARGLAVHVDTAHTLTGLARDGMRPALITQDENRAVGAGPKIHATARSN